MKWIPTSERLPEEGQDILITYLCDGKPDVGIWNRVEGADDFLRQYVKAWMPLPEPWRGENDEDSD